VTSLGKMFEYEYIKNSQKPTLHTLKVNKGLHTLLDLYIFEDFDSQLIDIQLI
jgi:hypothetical protein